MALVLVLAPACGVRRVAGYLEELDNCLQKQSECGSTSGETSDGSTHDTEPPGGSTTSSDAGSDTTTASENTTRDTTSTISGETSTASTGEPLAVCGNGVLEAFGAQPEECDDANVVPDDGCDETCALDRGAFVTSIKYQAGQLESLYIADALCFNRADDQGLTDALKYRAWLSDSGTDARDRFKRGRGRLVLVNGLVLAASWSALLAGPLANPFEVTEKGETYHGGVWTGTRPDGTAVPGAQHCDDWSTTSFTKTGHYGYSDRTTPEWTLSAAEDNPILCPAEFAVYCLQTL
jgi:cysteine-rich repeat protein